MKVKFCCDSGANIHSCREEIIDVTECYDLSEEEWKSMSDEDKFEILNEWAHEKLDIYYVEEEE